MISKQIVDSDAFLDMPVTARLLYYDLNIRADDDGFVNSPKKIMRMVGASNDDMRILIDKKFVIYFDTGVVVIKHWRIHNYIRRDTYTETTYREEKALLELDENKSYRDTRQRSVDEPSTQIRLDKVRIGKDRKEKRYGEFENVALTDDEKNKLIQSIGIHEFENYVSSLDLYIAQKGKKYKSHYATILNWYRRDHETKKREDIAPVYDASRNPGAEMTAEQLEEEVKRIRGELHNVPDDHL